MPEQDAGFRISLSTATVVWIQWAWIALDHRDEARAAAEAGGRPTRQPELQASMISIAASAFAIDGFATVVREKGHPPEIDGEGKPPRANLIWESLRANFSVTAKTQTWPRELKRLLQLRSSGSGGGLAHPKNIPGEPGEPSYARMTYTAETATWATHLMAEIVTACDLRSVKPDAPPALLDPITGYDSYAAEFADRTGIPWLSARCTLPL